MTAMRLTLTEEQKRYFRRQSDDTELHILACHMADEESFRLYGTDSIGDYEGNYTRWLGLYDQVIKQVFEK